MSTTDRFRCGFVALAGRSNVGKSTLLNAMVGKKLSIVTHKPQTTRVRLTGIRNTARAQILFVDAPGLHRGATTALNRVMNRTALQTIAEGDVILFVVESFRWTAEDQDLIRPLSEQDRPVICVANKIDKVHPREKLLPQLESLATRMDFAEVVPVSAQRGDNLDTLEKLIVDYLPAGPPLFPSDATSDRSEAFHAAEIVREQLLLRLQQELPYGTQVGIEHLEDGDDLVQVNAVVWVERSAHKAIVIGRQGQMLKGIGTAARHELERRYGKKVNLELWVKVREHWSNNPGDLARFGYDA